MENCKVGGIRGQFCRRYSECVELENIILSAEQMPLDQLSACLYNVRNNLRGCIKQEHCINTLSDIIAAIGKTI